jgi:c-di-GMP-binding flagellar brake protein YcgR
LQNQRKHKRFRLRLINIESKVNLVGKVDVVDMSLGGALLRTEGKLALGKECSIQFGYRGMQYPVKGMVIRSELSGICEQSGNKSVSRYLVGIMFKEGSAGTVKEFLDSIEQSSKVEMPATANWRFRDVQFNLTTPSEKVLEFPGQFTIQDISKSGVIIHAEQQLSVDSMLLLELSLDAAAPISFMGKVVSCRSSRDWGQGGYAVGVEFTELTDSAVEVLQQFMESLKNGHT